MDNRYSLQTLIANAKQGITSRQAYIWETIHKIADMPLYAFVDRTSNDDSNAAMMRQILCTLQLSEKCMEISFKDLIFLLLSYKNSEDWGLRRRADDAMWQLANLAEKMNMYKYVR
ncbi:MAG: hypothetical protein NC347_15105 [Clostridium sp.]|nr:hypothetical protein [Clostridium sp.]